MSSCKIQIAPGEWKEGLVGYYDPKSNRYFVQNGDQFFWTPAASVQLTSPMQQIPGVSETNKIRPIDAVTNLDRNEEVNSDDILTMMQKLECDLLHANVRTDMRRIEFEYMLRRDQMKKRYQDGLSTLAAKKIPVSSSYHPYSKQKKPKQITPSLPSQLNQRQELLQWAYNHGNTWAKTYLHTRNTKKVPDNLRIKTDYLLKHENDLYTAAFHLDEFGYASLFPPILLQDTLSRVHNYLVYSKYNKPLERKSAAARIQTHYREFFIEKEQFIIGGISSLTFSDLQKLNPVVEDVLVNLGGSDLIVVDDHIPLQAVAIEWSEEQKCWYIRTMYPNVQFTLEEETTMSINEGQAKLKPSTYFSIVLNMSDPYANLNIGRLTLKSGVLKKKPKKSHKKKEKNTESAVVEAIPIEEINCIPTDAEPGTGRIISTGTVVYGKGTKFVSELRVGDAIAIQHPSTLGDEMRVVKIIASDTSLSLSSAFSSDFSTEINFMIYKKQDEYVPPEVVKEREKQERDALENSAFGIYKGAGGTEFTYKVKKQSAYGGWKTITKKTKRPLTREELLDMRVKNKSDRYCM